MKALAPLAAGLALLLAGCVQAPDATPAAAADLPADVGGLAVHRAGALVAGEPFPLPAVPAMSAILLGTRGGEPTMGVTSSGAAFIASNDYAMKSVDHGTTWEVSYEFGPAIAGQDPVSNSDPFLWVDPVTDRIFMPTMFPILACSEAIWSDDDGATWADKPLSCGIPGVDHQKVATGPYAAGSPLAPNPVVAYPNVVYYCYSKVVATHCAMSNDGGLTYPIDVQVTRDLCAGPNGVPATHTDGTVYLPLGGLGGCDTVAIAVSTDNGLTWTIKTPDVGDLGQDEIDPDITVTPDGTAYYTFRSSKDHVTYMIASNDHFDTIRGPWRVAPPDVTSTNFVGVTSGDDGRVAIAYLGTRDTDEFADAAPDETRWHLFVTYTFDAHADEPTFVTVQATPQDDPVQIGSIHYGGGGDPDRNLLDFIDATRGPDGRVWVTYTDGCTERCAEDPEATPDDSRARDTAVAVLTTGPRLLASVGTL